MKGLKEKFNQHSLTQEQMQNVQGGVPRSEYCATNHQIMQYCHNVGDNDCIRNGYAAWQTHCEPYGL
jgi:hypothetical protein